MVRGDAEVLAAQVVQARAHLADAAASADLAGIANALDELERIHSLAGESGIELPQPATAGGPGSGTSDDPTAPEGLAPAEEPTPAEDPAAPEERHS